MSTVAAEQALALPVSERINALLSIQEDQWFDRKSARIAPRELADLMIGFANAEGGITVVGLWRGKFEGVDGAAKRLNEWRQAAIDFTSPPVHARPRLLECSGPEGELDHLLVIEVQASDRVHANAREEVFLRVGDENRKLTFPQRQELLYDKGQSTFETTVMPGATLQDLDPELLSGYASAVGHPDPERLLAARGLVTRTREMTVAALLLFGVSPQQWFPEASVRVLRYRGSERGTGARQQLVADTRCEGPIPHVLGAARQAVLDHLPTRKALGVSGRFEQIGLIPEGVWLEGVVNAVVHRSYSIAGDHVRVEIFDDRVEIESPGRFPGLSDPRDPLHIARFARNPRLARICGDLRFGQELGEGIRRMFEEMRLAGLADPEYEQTAGSVRLRLLSAAVDRELDARLPPGAREAMRLIRDGQRLSTGDVVDALGRSRPVVLRLLRELEEVGLVEWIGHSRKDPRAYWRVKLE